MDWQQHSQHQGRLRSSFLKGIILSPSGSLFLLPSPTHTHTHTHTPIHGTTQSLLDFLREERELLQKTDYCLKRENQTAENIFVLLVLPSFFGLFLAMQHSLQNLSSWTSSESLGSSPLGNQGTPVLLSFKLLTRKRTFPLPLNLSKFAFHNSDSPYI